MKSWIYLLLALSMVFQAMAATAQRNRVPTQNEKEELVQVIDFTSESEPSDGGIYIVNDNYYVTSSTDSLLAKLNIDPKDVSQIRINMTNNPVAPNQAIIEYVRNRLPQKYRNFEAVATVYLKRKRR
jgi:hypothetical protein